MTDEIEVFQLLHGDKKQPSQRVGIVSFFENYKVPEFYYAQQFGQTEETRCSGFIYEEYSHNLLSMVFDNGEFKNSDTDKPFFLDDFDFYIQPDDIDIDVKQLFAQIHYKDNVTIYQKKSDPINEINFSSHHISEFKLKNIDAFLESYFSKFEDNIHPNAQIQTRQNSIVENYINGLISAYKHDTTGIQQRENLLLDLLFNSPDDDLIPYTTTLLKHAQSFFVNNEDYLAAQRAKDSLLRITAATLDR